MTLLTKRVHRVKGRYWWVGIALWGAFVLVAVYIFMVLGWPIR